MAEASVSQVTLSLSKEEASALLYLCNNIGGEPNNSARKYIDNISNALMNAEVTTPNSTTSPLHRGEFFFVFNSGSAIRGAA